jgi:hypothetical protein
MVTNQQFDLDQILLTWDYKNEQTKADFLEDLYKIYKPADKTYTGLWQRFLKDIGKIFVEDYKQDPEGLRKFLNGARPRLS